MDWQATIRNIARFTGVGLHSGEEVQLTVSPAPVDTGIRFQVTPYEGAAPVDFAALADRVGATAYATSLEVDGLTIHTVEHLMAALAGLGIDNALISLFGTEVPIMDGSAAPFVHGLLKVGRVPQPKRRRVIRITAPIRISEDCDAKWIEVTPTDVPEFVIDYHIDFDHDAVGRQRRRYVHSQEAFVAQVASARTFGFAHEVAALRQLGLARGGSLENAVVIDDQGVMNPEGLRFTDEQVRHKLLDLVGDLALVGAPIHGQVSAYRSGHGLHTRLAQAILARPDCWEWATESPRELFALAG